MQTRADHLQWCKDRAIEYCDNNDPLQALTSMMSDLRKHEETKDHPAIKLCFQMMIQGLLNTPAEAKKYILDFN